MYPSYLWVTLGQSLCLSWFAYSSTRGSDQIISEVFLLNPASIILSASFSYSIRFEFCVSMIANASLWTGNQFSRNVIGQLTEYRLEVKDPGLISDAFSMEWLSSKQPEEVSAHTGTWYWKQSTYLSKTDLVQTLTSPLMGCEVLGKLLHLLSQRTVRTSEDDGDHFLSNTVRQTALANRRCSVSVLAIPVSSSHYHLRVSLLSRICSLSSSTFPNRWNGIREKTGSLPLKAHSPWGKDINHHHAIV